VADTLTLRPDSAPSVEDLHNHPAAGRPAPPAVGAPAVTPAAVDPRGAGQFCGVSRSQWWKLHSSGKVPLPVYLGSKAPRWRIDELRAWLAAGCPCRQEWQRMKEAPR
jgi:predicted DNA-binding transcriptional regulator AlpA